MKEGQDRICLVNRAANATETTLDSDVMQSEVNGAPIEFITGELTTTTKKSKQLSLSSPRSLLYWRQ